MIDDIASLIKAAMINLDIAESLAKTNNLPEYIYNDLNLIKRQISMLLDCSELEE